MNRMDKQALRRAVRARFPGMEARARESGLICRHVKAWQDYQRAEAVAGYVPMPHEADIMPLLADVLASGKTLLLPRVEEGARRMTLRRVERLDSLVPGRWGIPEPPADAEIAPVEGALLLVPLEAVDRTGARLGKGGGYYDALLRDAETMTLGVALFSQWVDHVPREAWDQRLRAVVDHEGIHDFRRLP